MKILLTPIPPDHEQVAIEIASMTADVDRRIALLVLALNKGGAEPERLAAGKVG